MYIPSSFNQSDPRVLRAFMRQYSFATVITGTGAGMVASHLPLLLDEKRGSMGTLSGHVAIQNLQWRAFQQGAEALVIFHGPHAYISPSLYKSIGVPTWNYAVIHAYGISRLMDIDALPGHLERLVETYESPRPRPWSLKDLPEEFVTRMRKNIVGFEIEISRLEGKWKLNQNRSAEDRQAVIDALLHSGEPDSIAVAQAMAERMANPPRS